MEQLQTGEMGKFMLARMNDSSKYNLTMDFDLDDKLIWIKKFMEDQQFITNNFVLPLILLLGTFGNILIIVIMIAKRKRRQDCAKCRNSRHLSAPTSQITSPMDTRRRSNSFNPQVFYSVKKKPTLPRPSSQEDMLNVHTSYSLRQDSESETGSNNSKNIKKVNSQREFRMISTASENEFLLPQRPHLLCIHGPDLHQSHAATAASKSAFETYLMVLAIADLLVLYVRIPSALIDHQTQAQYLKKLSTSWCKAMEFLEMFSMNWAVGMVCLLSVDRMLNVVFPLLSRRLEVVRRAKLLIVLSIVIAIAINIHLVFVYYLKTHSIKSLHIVVNTCETIVSFSNRTKRWMDLLTYGLLPFFIVLITNGSIIVVLVKSHWKFDTPFQRDTVILLISICLLFFITTVPYNCVLLYEDYIQSLHGNEAKLTTEYLVSQVLEKIAIVLCYLNHSLNFLVYGLIGQKFRRDTRLLYSDVKARFVKYFQGNRNAESAPPEGMEMANGKKPMSQPPAVLFSISEKSPLTSSSDDRSDNLLKIQRSSQERRNVFFAMP